MDNYQTPLTSHNKVAPNAPKKPGVPYTPKDLFEVQKQLWF
jgi:hypothetical protein